jgi:hypothetical protein
VLKGNCDTQNSVLLQVGDAVTEMRSRSKEVSEQVENLSIEQTRCFAVHSDDIARLQAQHEVNSDEIVAMKDEIQNLKRQLDTPGSHMHFHDNRVVTLPYLIVLLFEGGGWYRSD